MYINSINNNSLNFTAKASTMIKAKESIKEVTTKLIEIEKKKLEFDEKILRYLLMGFSPSELAEKMNISLYKTNLLSAKYNAHRIYIQRRDDIILEKLRNGASRKTVMKEMNVSKKTVQEVAEANNVYRENQKERDLLIIEKIKSGISAVSIAKELGISEATVGRAVQKFGLTINELKKLVQK